MGLHGPRACQRPLEPPGGVLGCPSLPPSTLPRGSGPPRHAPRTSTHRQPSAGSSLPSWRDLKSTTFRSTHCGGPAPAPRDQGWWDQGLSPPAGLSPGTLSCFSHSEAAAERVLHPQPEGGGSKRPGTSSQPRTGQLRQEEPIPPAREMRISIPQLSSQDSPWASQTFLIR